MGRIGFAWWTQLPFVKCENAEQFLVDIHFPPTRKDKYVFGFKFIQLIHLSWLWARKGFLPERIHGDEECGKWCSMEWLGGCKQFPVRILGRLGALWMPAAVWPRRHEKQHKWSSTNVFMIFHTDRIDVNSLQADLRTDADFRARA